MCDTDEKKEKKTQFVAVSVHLCSLDLLDQANANIWDLSLCLTLVAEFHLIKSGDR